MASTRWVALLALLTSCGPDETPTDQSVGGGSDGRTQSVMSSDGTAENARARELLTFAFDAASRFPLESRVHAKNRSRAQHRVSHAALELGLVDLARQQVEPNEGWQKGLVLAEIALHLATAGETEGLDAMLEQASLYADEIMKDPNQQAFRRARVRVTIARAYAVLGQTEQVAKFLNGAEPAELERARTDLAQQFDDAQMGQILAEYDALKKTGSFEGLLGAADTLLVFHERKYGNAVLRGKIEQAILDITQKLPLEKQFGYAMKLAEPALAAGETDEVARWIARGEELLGPMLPDQRNSPRLSAELAVLEHRAGKTDEARSRLAKVLERFDAAEEAGELVNIYMADALTPIAAAYWQLGNKERAQAIYRRSLEAAVLNPNSRPRCFDLVDLCISLALHDVEPSAELTARMNEVRDQLGDPW